MSSSSALSTAAAIWKTPSLTRILWIEQLKHSVKALCHLQPVNREPAQGETLTTFCFRELSPSAENRRGHYYTLIDYSSGRRQTRVIKLRALKDDTGELELHRKFRDTQSEKIVTTISEKLWKTLDPFVVEWTKNSNYNWNMPKYTYQIFYDF